MDDSYIPYNICLHIYILLLVLTLELTCVYITNRKIRKQHFKYISIFTKEKFLDTKVVVFSEYPYTTVCDNVSEISKKMA